MNTNCQILIDLLQSALWNRPAQTAHWPTQVDWDGVYALAKNQAVRGIVIDALLDLPSERLPERAWYEKRLVRLMQTAQESAKHFAVSQELLQRFKDEGIHAQLMKGVSMSALYPHPQYRACGDIDLYIGPTDYDRSIQLMCTWASTLQTDVVKDDKHTSIYYQGIQIELHRITEYFSVPVYNRRWQEWTLKSLSSNTSHEFPVAYNAVFLFNHIWHHFCIYGIGLRQFCDWALFLHHHADVLDRTQLETDLKRIGLFRQWQMFGCVAVNVLGLPEGEFPFYCASYKGKAANIITQVFEDGNFGQSGPWLGHKPHNYLKRKLHSAYFWCRRLVVVAHFSPLYATFTVLDYLKYGIEVVYNDLTGRK